MPYKDKEKQKVAQREHYERNRQKVIDAAGINRNNFREKLRNIANEAKNKPCGDCKKSYPPCVMEFHHRPGEEKLDVVARMVWKTSSLPKLLAEIKKCDVLCSNCHRMRTYNCSPYI